MTPGSFRPAMARHSHRRVLRLGMLMMAACCGVSALLGPSRAVGCPYSIRDSSFMLREAPAPYRLFVVIDPTSHDREAIQQWLDDSSEAWLSDSNVLAGLISRDDSFVKNLGEKLARRSSPEAVAAAFEKLPLGVLVSPEGTATLLGHLGSDEISLDGVMSLVAASVESPLRQEISQNLVDAWCVALLLEGTDADENLRVEKALKAASRRITGTTTEMDKVVTTGPHVIRLSPEKPQEQVLLWSLGLDQAPRSDSDATSATDAKTTPDAQSASVANSPDADKGAKARRARVAVIVGRGELRGGVLVGEDANEERIFRTFEMLGRSCTCTTDDVWLSGPRLPMNWGPNLQAAAEIALGFDPNSPESLDILNKALGSGQREAPPLAYRETFFDEPVPESDSQSVSTSTAEGTENPPEGGTPLAAEETPPAETLGTGTTDANDATTATASDTDAANSLDSEEQSVAGTGGDSPDNDIIVAEPRRMTSILVALTTGGSLSISLIVAFVFLVAIVVLATGTVIILRRS